MRMKMLMIIIDEAKREELEVLLSRVGVAGYTEVSRVVGMGATGPRLGSRAFPKASAVVFTVLSPEALQTVQRGVEEFCAECGERLRIMAWDVNEIAYGPESVASGE